ncbi:hypothetical protein J5491_03965 [Candidatus Saccharibacteria bacterium]|nr:hypothetical protein [Candidatus Saccharibacteria bacterium]
MGVRYKHEVSQRSILLDRAMNCWDIYSLEYRTIVTTYEELLEEKRERKIPPLCSFN